MLGPICTTPLLIVLSIERMPLHPPSRIWNAEQLSLMPYLLQPLIIDGKEDVLQ